MTRNDITIAYVHMKILLIMRPYHIHKLSTTNFYGNNRWTRKYL